MQFNFRGKYDPTQNYSKKDVVSYQPIANGTVTYHFCLSDILSTSPQTPSQASDSLYWGLLNVQSNFPNSVDSFLSKANIQASDKADLSRINTLSLQSSLTSTEQDELTTLLNKQRNKLILADDFNALQQAISNLQMYFKDNVDSTLTTYQNNIQTTKDDALIAIEQKKENVIEYMDGTTAGALRNDLGVMGDLTTTDKTSLVNAINEVNAKDVDLTPINNKIGDITTLETTAKDNLVHAINEVKEDINNINLTASNVSITDAGNYITATNVEGALQEFGLAIVGTSSALVSEVNAILNG
jgi:hypothetical protein